MVRSKAASKKQKKSGIDFKKIKRKIGRKLPPPKNATNTEIKSKGCMYRCNQGLICTMSAIILPEQSVASEKAGLAVNKKGLTLKELLQQTSHHNAKIRKGALVGIRDLFMKYPAELRLHRYTVIEKLRERIDDGDKVVRETLYQLLKSVIFPGCKEENQGLFISLLMGYIFNAMIHLSIDVRMMAFKFFELLVEYYPSSFFLHADKILQNYAEILQKNQFYLQDKGKLKNALTGLVQCLSLLPCNKRGIGSSDNNVVDDGMLHAFEPHVPTESAGACVIIKNLEDLVLVLLNCFQEFMPAVHDVNLLNIQIYDCILYIVRSIHLAVQYFFYGSENGKVESHSPCKGSDTRLEGTISSALLKKLLSVFPLNPLHHISEKDHDRLLTLNVIITEIFLHSIKCINPPIAILETFLEFIESVMLGKIVSGTHSRKVVREKHVLPLLPFIPELIAQAENTWKFRLLENLENHIHQLKYLQAFTHAFKDCHPESSLKLACLHVVEELIIPTGELSCIDTSFPEIVEHRVAWIRELPLLLILLGDNYPSCSEVVLRLLLHVGQASFLNSALKWEYDNTQHPLQEFYHTSSAEGPELQPETVFRIIEVLHSAYKVGHIQIADYISFCATLLSCFKVSAENGSVDAESNKLPNYETLKSINKFIT
uniref:Pre-rRNA-processing protein Ipi1 N-terminal domain-containing protein n=1 Tax=Cucumis melo TaxID=3656 RepID=A0A9I9CWU2_CUCME